jgi:chromosomal replication initiation ATPase DnaA
MTVTIGQIQAAVADFFNLPLEEVMLHSGKRVIALPLPIAMFLARQFTIFRSSIAMIDEQRRSEWLWTESFGSCRRL